MGTTLAPSTSHAKPASGQKPASASSVVVILLGILALALGAAYLLKTNPATGKWAQAYDPTGHWWLSTILAALPVFVLLGAMALLHMKAHIAAVWGLLTALTIAIVVYHMPVRLALTTTAFGAGYGLFPICWIILPVIFLYQLTVKTGRFTALQESLTNITDDGRLQLLLIAFALGAFFEGAAGFGTPVAVCGAILISLGFKPIQAAGLSLIANTAPVAFGGLGIPIVTLNLVTGIDVFTLSKMIAIILVPFCLLVPFWLIWVYAGFKAMLEIWPAILVAAVTFATAQYLMATYTGPWLVAIVAAAFDHCGAGGFPAVLEAEADFERGARGYYRTDAATVRPQHRRHCEGVAAVGGVEPGGVCVGDSADFKAAELRRRSAFRWRGCTTWCGAFRRWC
jgi:hypothetical protein